MLLNRNCTLNSDEISEDIELAPVEISTDRRDVKCRKFNTEFMSFRSIPYRGAAVVAVLNMIRCRQFRLLDN